MNLVVPSTPSYSNKDIGFFLLNIILNGLDFTNCTFNRLIIKGMLQIRANNITGTTYQDKCFQRSINKNIFSFVRERSHRLYQSQNKRSRLRYLQQTKSKNIFFAGHLKYIRFKMLKVTHIQSFRSFCEKLCLVQAGLNFEISILGRKEGATATAFQVRGHT